MCVCIHIYTCIHKFIYICTYPWEWLPTLVFLPGVFHGQRNLAGYSPWCCRGLDPTHTHTHIHRNIVLVVKWCSTLLQPHGLQLTRLLCPWGFPGQEYWGELPFPFPRDLPKTGIEPESPALQADSFLLSHQEKKKKKYIYIYVYVIFHILSIIVYHRILNIVICAMQ